MPTMRYRTPSASSASNNARSAGVRTMSNTGQTSTQPLGGRETETAEGVVHIAGVDVWIRRRDGVRFAPQRLALTQPGAFNFGEIGKLLAGVHERR